MVNLSITDTDYRVACQLLALLRGDDEQEFTLSVSLREGRWCVRTETPGMAYAALEGWGDTFPEAWEAQEPLWARDDTALKQGGRPRVVAAGDADG